MLTKLKGYTSQTSLDEQEQLVLPKTSKTKQEVC